MGRALAAVVALLVSAAAAGNARAERPRPGFGFSDGATVLSFASPGGDFRVWYAVDTVDAVPLADDDGSGVPDYVELAARIADDSLAAFAEHGFRAPIRDTSLTEAAEAGGDDRIDLYLLEFNRGDGHFQQESCVADSRRCSGYLEVENDFADTGYASAEEALKTVVSHELFHAVQAAYDTGRDVKWSEGSAVWAEELVFPEQRDFEGQLRGFLRNPGRPFDRRSGASLGDSYPYGAALWPTFLEERYETDIVEEMWALCDRQGGSDRDHLDAARDALAARGALLSDEWVEFTRWNLFTGPRARHGRSYGERAAGWGEVSLEEPLAEGAPMEVRLEGLSARYIPVSMPIDAEKWRYQVTALEPVSAGARAALFFAEADGTLGAPHEFGGDGDRLELEIASPEGAASAFLVVTSATRGAPDRRFELEVAPPSSGGCAAAGERSPLSAALLLGLFLAGRRRRRA